MNTSGECQRGPREAGGYAASVDFEEVVATLAVPSGAESQHLEHLGLHRVVPVLVIVDVLSELDEAMLSELDEMAINCGSLY